jgi:hypothetical protein
MARTGKDADDMVAMRAALFAFRAGGWLKFPQDLDGLSAIDLCRLKSEIGLTKI